MKLNEIKDNPGAVQARKRVGRGIGSGLGKTAGAGHKGQKARSGVAIKGFEGGQMPIHRRLPKRGFTPPSRKRFNELNLDRLQAAIDAGKIDASAVVTNESLVEAGVFTRAFDGMRLLGGGELKAKVTLQVAGASRTAREAVAKAGGGVELLGPKADDAAVGTTAGGTTAGGTTAGGEEAGAAEAE